MIQRFFATLVFVLGITAVAFSQNDPVLFTVDGTPVHASEFDYIYSKTNGDKANYSKPSLDEYLDLYTKFKLKVKKAKDMKLDTIPALKQELAGYRRQLADSYLLDKEVTETLTREVYERRQQDVDISHIMISLRPDADSKALKEAAGKLMAAKKRLAAGEEFAKVAREVSEDKSAARNKGNIGYVTSLFPNGYYNLESAAYKQKVGEISDPIRTTRGLHLLKVNDRRPARGEMEVAHILLRFDKSGNKLAVENRIKAIKTEIEAGADFEEIAKAKSEDKTTATKGGYIGFFGINKYEKAFENAAFALTKNGELSKPFETKAGFHVIKRISKKTFDNYNVSRGRLQALVKKDQRFEAAKDGMVDRIKKEANFQANEPTLKALIGSLDESFETYKWKAPKDGVDKALMTFGKDYTVTVGEFFTYLSRGTRKRIQMVKSKGKDAAVRELFADFVNENTLKYEEQQLESKYPEFKSLMREYEEGILLFEATKLLVWDKASQDSTGLDAFFGTVADKYNWKERAVVSIYEVRSEDEALINKIRKYAAKKSPAKVMKKFNTGGDQPLIIRTEKKYEEGRNKVLKTMNFKKGALSASEANTRSKITSFMKIESIMSEAPKTLAEARGYVVADYQDFLEKEWIEELRNAYPVKVNQKVFDSLIK